MGSVVNLQKLPPVIGFLARKPPAKAFQRHGAVLKPTLRKDRHVQTSHCFYSARDNFPFELIQLVHVIIGQRDERDALGLLNHSWPRERTEAFKAKMTRRRVGARVRA